MRTITCLYFNRPLHVVPWLNVKRLDEAVSVDPFFANCKSIVHGFTGAYLFLGVDSRYLKLYGFKLKGGILLTFSEITSMRKALLVSFVLTMARS